MSRPRLPVLTSLPPQVSRDMIGMTNPLTSPPGTVRGDLACNIGRNVIHGSDGVEGAASEIPLCVPPKWPSRLTCAY